MDRCFVTNACCISKPCISPLPNAMPDATPNNVIVPPYVALRSAGDGDGKFSVRAGAGGREVLATMDIEDGVTLELAVRLPAAWPLQAAAVECRRKVRCRTPITHDICFVRCAMSYVPCDGCFIGDVEMAAAAAAKVRCW